ncbi:MAG TPA: elongation factor P [Erysipelothrix sp.]|nr:elongation factor P [Erysipelothrix sp.]
MISSNDLRNGMSILHEDNLYQVLDQSQNKTALRQMIVKVKVKNMNTGSITELSFTGGEKVKLAHIDKKVMQYLYDAQDTLVFMDNETYEQIELAKETLEWELNFLKENQDVTMIMFEDNVIGVQLPEKIELEVIEAEPAVKGDTATNAQKNAVVETGLEIRVPLFIAQGEKVVVTTSDGKYAGRAR